MILVDSSYIVSYFINTEENHKKSLKIWEDIKNKEKIITNLIVAEMLNLLSKKLRNNTNAIIEIYGAVIDNYTIIYENKALHDKSMKTFIKYDTYLSLADCLNIETMKEKGIYEIVSFDNDFDRVKEIQRIF